MDTTFSAGTVVASTWLNDVNDFTYKSWFVNASAFGALNDGTTDNTAAVQLALDSLGAAGGVVQVASNTKFNLQSLVFPQRSNLDYWMDCDLSRPNPSTTLGTNERILFMANANNDGIVNETRVTAPFHPGLNIDVRRDVSGHDAYLGTGQVRVPTALSPARASINFQDQQVETWRKMYEIFGGDYSNFSGVSEYTWYRTVVLTGVGTGAGGWVSVPSVGTEITGSLSGAKGWFLSATTTTTTVLWNSGRFAASDHLIDNNETSVNTVSSVLFDAIPMPSLTQDLRKGVWSIGLPAGSSEESLNVAGRIAILPTQSIGQHMHQTIASPGLVFADAITYVPTNGYVIRYDTTPAAASRRLSLRKLVSGAEDSQDVSILSATRAFVQFNNSAIKSDSSFNVTSVVRTGTGVYEINLPSGVLTRLDPCVTFGTENPLNYAVWDFSSSTLTKLVIKTYTTGTSTLADLNGRVSVCINGGDI